MAGPISRLLDPARIQLNLQSTQHVAALEETAGLLKTHPDVHNFDGFFQELLVRDRLDTTYLGYGVALPHARTEHVKNIVMAVGCSKAGVPFDNGQASVRIMFLLGTPKTKPGEYLQVMSALCKVLQDPVQREMLLRVTTPDDFIATMIAAEEKRLRPA
ncbi:MAG: PTS sugar transporter subunit IIA [Opitutae bacterium]|nr:PTS sugar transporter subunit IIA [Opitutae bacterium]